MDLNFIKKHAASFIFILIFAIALHFYFLKDAIPFLYSGGDPFDQFAKFQLFLHSNYRDWNFEWSWLNGFGGDLIGQFNYYFSTSLFFLFKLFFPLNTFLQLADINLYVSIGKAALASIFFYIYMITNDRTRTSALFGAIIYLGSIKFMQLSFFSEFMSDIFVFLPLAMWGLERLLKKGKPILFIIMIFCIVQSNFYFAYITTIYIGIYTVIYLLTTTSEQSIKNFSKKVGAVALSYVAGFLLAAFSFFPAVYQFLNAYRFSKEYPIPTLFPTDFYLNMPVGLFFNISMITIPAIVVLILLAAVQFRKSIPKVHLWTVFIFFLFYQIPMMYSVFNGFSAMQSRWTYLLIFAIAVVTTYTVDEWQKGKNIHFSLVILYYGFLLYALFVRDGLQALFEFDYAWAIMSLHLLLPIFLLIRKKWRLGSVAVMLSLLVVLVSMQQTAFFESQLGDSSDYKETITARMASYDEERKKQEVVEWLNANETSFSRTAWYLPYSRQIDNFTQHNNSLLNGLPSLSTYHSLMTSDLGKFIYEDYKIKQFDSFSHFYNVDERLFLETYLQANYMIVNEGFSYSPDGYELVHSTSHYRIYKLAAPMPFAYMQNRVIQAKDFDTLSVGSRDMLLLQAYRSEKEASTQQLESYDLPVVLFEADQPFEDSAYFNENEKTLELHEETTFTIPLSEIPTNTSQVLASFTIEEVTGEAFTVNMGNTFMEKREYDHIYALPIKDFTMHVDQLINTNELTFTLPEGSYHLSKLLIEMLPFEQIENYQQDAIEHAFELVKMHKNKVSLSGHAKEDGMLVTSIPYSEGWQVKVDGKKLEAERINEAFLGVPLVSGDQSVELTYQSPYLRTGLSLSLSTLILLIGIRFFRRYKKV